MSSRASEPARAPAQGRVAEKLKAYFELTKPRIALLVLAVAVGSFYLASPGNVNWVRLAETAVGVSLLAFGIFALNHYAERTSDGLMLRTAAGPCRAAGSPRGKPSPSALFLPRWPWSGSRSRWGSLPGWSRCSLS